MARLKAAVIDEDMADKIISQLTQMIDQRLAKQSYDLRKDMSDQFDKLSQRMDFLLQRYDKRFQKFEKNYKARTDAMIERLHHKLFDKIDKEGGFESNHTDIKTEMVLSECIETQVDCGKNKDPYLPYNLKEQEYLLDLCDNTKSCTVWAKNE